MSPAGNAELLRAEILGKAWGAEGKGGSCQPVLGPITLALGAGEVVALSGPSGCGKSTLLAILAGLDNGFQGKVSRASGLRPAMVFQSPRLLPWRTAEVNVAMAVGGGAVGGGAVGGGAEALTRARRALAELGASDLADIYPARLSLGMARRVALARALVVDPDLLFLDEAFVSLDPSAAEQMRAAVLNAVAQRGMAVLMVSHDEAESAAMADRQLRLQGKPARLTS